MKNFSANVQGPRRRYSLLRGSNGYLMLEILMAVAIFSLGFLAVGTLIISTTRNNTTGNVITQATMLAAEQLQNLKDTPAAVITNLASGVDPEPIDFQGNPGGIYTRSWTVSDPLANATSRRIQVRVSWKRLGQTRAVELATITRGNGT
jgi:type IV pilus assembly protein PilV